MAVQVVAYRPRGRTDIAYEDWKDEAACDGMPAYLFELLDFDEVPQEDQHEAIAKGLKVCATCPVRQLCKDTSTEVDRFWTTRGGQPPEGLFPDVWAMDVRPKGFIKEGTRKRDRCKNNHDDWRIKGSNGSRYCNTCRKGYDALRSRT